MTISELKEIKKILKEVKEDYITTTGVKQDYTINRYQTLIDKVEQEILKV